MPDFLNATVSKIETVAADENRAESQANQDSITVENLGNNEYKILVDGILNSFESTNPGQGIGTWIGLVVDTGESDITNVKYNGIAFTAADVAEADSVGAGNGCFVWWIKEENLPEEITLSTDGKADTVIKIIE